LKEIPSNGSGDTVVKILCFPSKVFFIGVRSKPTWHRL